MSLSRGLPGTAPQLCLPSAYPCPPSCASLRCISPAVPSARPFLYTSALPRTCFCSLLCTPSPPPPYSAPTPARDTPHISQLAPALAHAASAAQKRGLAQQRLHAAVEHHRDHGQRAHGGSAEEATRSGELAHATPMQTDTHARTLKNARTHMHTCTRAHTHAHTHTHTHTILAGRVCTAGACADTP